MKRVLLLLVPLVCLGAAPASREVGTRFVAVDVMIDPKGQALAAWQVEFSAEVGSVSLVGVEAGEHAAYKVRPPYYDPKALAGNRVILGDYSLAAELPKGRTRVATVMLEVRGDAKPQYVTKLMAAADAEGKAVAADVTVVER
jgi:hypothetical protein